MHENFKEIEAGLSETVNLIRLAREKLILEVEDDIYAI